MPMMWIAAASTVMSVAGGVQASKAAKRQGKADQAAAEYEAEQNRVNAIQAVASAQRAAMEERRQGELVQSRAIALMAASGGGVSDPGNVVLLSRNAGEIAYRSAVALYEGEDRARSMNMSAESATYSGAMARRAGNDRARAYQTKAFGDLLSGGNSLYQRYGASGVPIEQSPAPVEYRTPTPVR